MKNKPPTMKKHGSSYLAVRSAVSETVLRRERNFTRQFMIDAAVLAVHRTFGTGPKRMQDFYVDLHEVMQEMATMICTDSRADKDLEYSKAKLDEALRPLLGVNFHPYDERYGG